jgi:hypothetical protein
MSTPAAINARTISTRPFTIAAPSAPARSRGSAAGINSRGQGWAAATEQVRPGRVRRTWRNGPEGTPVVDLTIDCDEQSDRLARDQHEATYATKNLLMAQGFIVLVQGLCQLRLLSYRGSKDAYGAEQVA